MLTFKLTIISSNIFLEKSGIIKLIILIFLQRSQRRINEIIDFFNIFMRHYRGTKFDNCRQHIFHGRCLRRDF